MMQGSRDSCDKATVIQLYPLQTFIVSSSGQSDMELQYTSTSKKSTVIYC